MKLHRFRGVVCLLAGYHLFGCRFGGVFAAGRVRRVRRSGAGDAGVRGEVRLERLAWRNHAATV